MTDGDPATKSLLAKTMRNIRDLWMIVGVTVLLLVLVEVGARVLFLTKDALTGPPVDGWCERVMKADAYRDEEWSRSYCQEHNQVNMEWHSYVYWRRQPFAGTYINVDANGFRRTYEHQASAQCESEPHRIFVLGGSTIWSPGVRDDYTIPSHLARLLEQQGVCADVVNLGEQGYVSAQELILLRRTLQAGDIPSLVVFYDGVNETFSAFQNQEAGLPQNENNRRNEFNILKDEERISDAYFATAAMPEGIGRLGNAIMNRLAPSGGSFGVEAMSRRAAAVEIEDPDALMTDIVEVYQSNVELVEVLADHYGFETLFYWQPLIFTKQNLSEYEQRWHDIGSVLWKDFLLEVYDRVERDPNLNQMDSFHNISAVFDETEEPYYLDAFHLTEAGNLAIAKEMVGDVVQTLGNTPEGEPR